MAFFEVSGTYINESGAEHFLTKYGVLAEGSLNDFIRRKYYNRCTRIHEILAAVMERKLYQNFLTTLPHETQDYLQTWLQEFPHESTEVKAFLEASPLFRDQMEQYEQYFMKVMQGELGPIAQYWYMSTICLHDKSGTPRSYESSKNK